MYVCELTKRKYRGKKPREIRGPDDVVAFVGPKLRKEQRDWQSERRDVASKIEALVRKLERLES